MIWQDVRLGHLVEDIYDGPHDTPKKTATGPVFLGISSLVAGRIDLSDAEHLSEADFEKWTKRVVPRPGDIVFSYETRIGEAAMIPEGLRCCLGRRMGLLRPDRSKVLPAYLLYAFLGPDFQATLRARTVHGSTVDRILLTELADFPIRVPRDLQDQEQIVRHLRPLDEKIDLNRQMNRTLEEIAQMLFRAWFVEFEGESDLVESELGPIPRGWEVVPLGEIAENRRDTRNPDDIDPETPYIGLGDLVPQTITSYAWGRAGDAFSTKVGFEEGDLLFGKLRPYFKKVIVAPFPGVCSSDMLVLRPRESKWFGFLLGLLTLDMFIDFCDGASTGTRMPRINWKTMSRYPIAVPKDRRRVRQFSDLVRTLVDRIEHNMFESRTLAELRDTLLPKLISGEIRVPEAEELAREAV